MQMFRKIGNEVILIYNPRNEGVEVGESIKILDSAAGRGLIVQVIEQSLVDLTGILEEIIRSESIGEIDVEEHVSPEFERYRFDVRNMKFARAKIRKEITVQKDQENIVDWTGWVPDRSADATPIEDDWLIGKLGIAKENFKHPITVGETAYTKRPFVISAFHLQGITLIVGKKGTGKSHVAKALLLGLIEQGAKGIIFDINDEYSAMRFKEGGKVKQKSPYHDKIIPLDPGNNLRFTLPYIGADVFFDVIQTSMGLPEPSAFDLKNFWGEIEQAGQLSYTNLVNSVAGCGDKKIKGALNRRLERMSQTELFVDEDAQATTLETELKKVAAGGALVVNLKMKNKDTIDLVVQTVLRKTQQLLEAGFHPLFIFAEEAHMYLRETNWSDAVTRMRHLGTYQIYMTNTPTEIRPLVIRQTDNLFLFHLTEPTDLQYLTPATRIDPETIEQIGRALPFRTCLAVGDVTKHYPFVISPKPLPVQTAGKTKMYFEEP